MVKRFRATEIFARLSKSSFRRGFHLNAADRTYLERKGMGLVLQHAADFVRKRLAPAHPSNDGKQTPWRGHPVFVAQHATATCCRGCLEKWHAIPKGREMTELEQRYTVQIVHVWLEKERDWLATAETSRTDSKDLFD
jgi:exodeoxyribonuclease V alpha subunit